VCVPLGISQNLTYGKVAIISGRPSDTISDGLGVIWAINVTFVTGIIEYLA